MPTRDVVVIAASAGGIEALREVLSGVPADYRGVVLIVLHMPSGGASTLPSILDRVSSLPVTEAADGEPLKEGHVYVCRSDHHLLLGEDRVWVRRGPMEHGHRPAADPLFRSAARYYGARVVGVVLSGTLSDGTDGLHSIRAQGGVAVVQDPADALYAGMPASALGGVGADHVVPAPEIGPLLARLAGEEVTPEPRPVTEELRRQVALMEDDDRGDGDQSGRPSWWPCPDCSGVLWEVEDDGILRFRCRVGHAWSSDSLVHEQGAEVEVALWMALRSLEDRATLSRTLADRAETAGRLMSARQFRADADDMTTSIEVLRRLLQGGHAPSAERVQRRG